MCNGLDVLSAFLPDSILVLPWASGRNSFISQGRSVLNLPFLATPCSFIPLVLCLLLSHSSLGTLCVLILQGAG